MLDLYKNIKNRRLQLSLTQEELAHKLGYSDKSMIAKIEKGSVDLSQTKIVAFAKALNCSASYLMGWEEKQEKSPPKGVKIPVLGRVAAGVPIEAVENIIDYEEISKKESENGEYFALKIKGDSMTPQIRDSDVVIVRKQDDAESDQIVIALINGDDATCKRLIKYSDGIGLISFNPAYPPMMFNKEEIEKKPVRIIGRVVENRQKW